MHCVFKIKLHAAEIWERYEGRAKKCDWSTALQTKALQWNLLRITRSGKLSAIFISSKKLRQVGSEKEVAAWRRQKVKKPATCARTCSTNGWMWSKPQCRQLAIQNLEIHCSIKKATNLKFFKLIINNILYSRLSNYF